MYLVQVSAKGYFTLHNTRWLLNQNPIDVWKCIHNIVFEVIHNYWDVILLVRDPDGSCYKQSASAFTFSVHMVYK